MSSQSKLISYREAAAELNADWEVVSEKSVAYTTMQSRIVLYVEKNTSDLRGILKNVDNMDDEKSDKEFIEGFMGVSDELSPHYMSLIMQAMGERLIEWASTNKNKEWVDEKLNLLVSLSQSKK